MAERTREDEIRVLLDSARSYSREAAWWGRLFRASREEFHRELASRNKRLRRETMSIIRFLLSGSFRKPKSLR